MFEPGQLVECVDDSGQVSIPGVRSEYLVQQGKVYTVRWVGQFVHPHQGDWGACVRVEGVTRPEPSLDGSDIPFGVERFRPLPEERLSIFRKMLEPVEDRDLVASSSVAAEG